MRCWICNSPGTTKEHLFKASDIKLYFPGVSQKNPIYLHKKNNKNIPIGSKKNDHLKSQALLCSQCNHKTTQQHDEAWKIMSNYISNNVKNIERYCRIDIKKVFPGNSTKSGEFMHLYFLKLFGCLLVESNNNTLAHELATCIIKGRPHPHVFLYISESITALGGVYYGVSDLDVVFSSSGVLSGAGWEYMIGEYIISLRYVRPGYIGVHKSNSWHPTYNSKIIKLSKGLSAV